MFKVGTLKRGFTLKTTLGFVIRIPRGTTVVAKTSGLYPEGVIQFKEREGIEIFQMNGELKAFLWGTLSNLMPFSKSLTGEVIYPYPISMIVNPDRR